MLRTRHEFRLNFQLRTTVRPSESDLIPLYGCKFVPFDEILQADGNFPFLVDVIGVLTVVGTEKEYDKDGRKLRMIVIELEADSLKIDIALFGDFVDEVSKFLSIGDVQRPIVVVQYAKLKTFKGKIVLQNVMYGTRILFNPDIPEALSLKKSLPPLEDDNSQILTIIPDPQSYSVEDDFLRATSRKSIEQLKDCKDDGFYVVLATVKGVNRGSDWWYTACKCNKAVTADSGMYYCDRCYRHVVNVVPRYRIKVRVMDDTDSTTFVIWDRDSCNILKKSCSELLESIHKGAGPVGFLVEFDEHMINKNFLFKVEVKSSIKSQFEPSYRVNRMSNDEDIITKFKESDPSFMAVEPDLTAGMSLGDTSFSLEFQDIQSSVSKYNVVQDSMIQFSEDNLTLGSQADVNILSETPVKFSSNDVGCALEGDMSTTKLNKVKLQHDLRICVLNL